MMISIIFFIVKHSTMSNYRNWTITFERFAILE